MGSYSICSSVGANTGDINCDIVRGNPLIIAAGSAVFAPGDYPDVDTFAANFIAKIKQASGTADKIFPFPVIQGTTDKTVAAKFATLGYGSQVKILASKAGYEFDVLCGSTLEAQLMAFDGQTLPLFIWDDKDQLAGIADGALNFEGADYLISLEPRSYGDAQNAKTTKVTISIVNSKDFTQNAKFLIVPFNTTDLVGLKTAITYEVSGHATNVYHIGVKIPTSNLLQTIDVLAQYGSALADSSLWAAGTGAGYATSLAITTVALTAGVLIFTFDSTAYTALASGTKIKLSSTGPADLDAADVDDTEIAPIILVK